MHTATGPLPIGSFHAVGDAGAFSYDPAFLANPGAFPLDPCQLPLGPGEITTPPDFPIFNAIRDAGPDAWGRRVVDAARQARGQTPAREIDYLLAPAPAARVGAMAFDPQGAEFDTDRHGAARSDWPALQAMAERVFAGQPIPEELLAFMPDVTAFGGARPKSAVEVDGQPMLLKLGLARDPINMAAAEAACLDLCALAGLPVGARDVVDIQGTPALLLERFDRTPAPAGGHLRRHFISGLTLLGAHEMDRASSGYGDITDALGPGQGEEIYMRMVMNVLTGNEDDHFRNHAFLLREDGRYAPSPVYDVTPTTAFSTNRRLFLHLGRAGQGREATLETAVRGAPSLGVAPARAAEIADTLSDIVACNWRRALSERGASASDITALENSFSEAGKRVATGLPSPLYHNGDEDMPGPG